jgi:hypothetical protein
MQVSQPVTRHHFHLFIGSDLSTNSPLNLFKDMIEAPRSIEWGGGGGGD